MSKEHLSYPELIQLLESRGMLISDKQRAERKLAQIGYSRLKDFWYPCRKLDTTVVVQSNSTQKIPKRLPDFEQDTDFNSVIELYLFDKKLRQLMLDAIERIEVHVRSVIAHEVGFHGKFTYQSQSVIENKQTSNWTDRRGNTRNSWNEWLGKHNRHMNRCAPACLDWYTENREIMPFWVVVEVWDFGLMSKYYEMLKGQHKNKIASRLGVGQQNVKALVNWLQEINTLRNRCAHHVRVWNQMNINPLIIPENDSYFKKAGLDHDARSRIYGLITVIWYLIKIIGPSSEWIKRVADLIDTKPDLPGCSYHAMGFAKGQSSFPRDKFDFFSPPPP